MVCEVKSEQNKFVRRNARKDLKREKIKSFDRLFLSKKTYRNKVVEVNNEHLEWRKFNLLMHHLLGKGLDCVVKRRS